MMKSAFLGIVPLLFGAAAAAQAQPRAQPPAPVETVGGEIVRVDRLADGAGRSAGIHLVLRTERETLEVALGPAWYVDGQEVKLAAGDRVEVRGARAVGGFIAAEVKKGDAVLRLRDENGLPLWRRGPGPRPR